MNYPDFKINISIKRKSLTNSYHIIRNASNVICIALILTVIAEKSHHLQTKSDYVKGNHNNTKHIVNVGPIKKINKLLKIKNAHEGKANKCGSMKATRTKTKSQ